MLKAAAAVARGGPVILARIHLGTEFTGGAVAVEPPPAAAQKTPSRRRTLQESVQDYQRELVRDALAERDENVARAARLLGMDRGNLHHLATRLGLIPRKTR